MKAINLLTLLLAIHISTIGLTSASPPSSSHHHHHQTTSSFIHNSCKTTLYPSLCEASLSVYARSVRRSPRNLAHAALSLSLSRALDASSLVSRLSSPSESTHGSRSDQLDCMQALRDSAEWLRRSVKELSRPGRYGSKRYEWHLRNMQTWVSAALTDQSTCLESLKEYGKGNNSVALRKRIMQVAQLTSNALALVNQLQGPN